MKIINIICSIIALFLGVLVIYWGILKEEFNFLMISHILIGIYAFVLSFLLFKGRNNTKTDRIKKWEQTRKKGVISFILLKGILAIGLPLGFMRWALSSDKNEQNLWFISFTVYVFTGAIFGWLTWSNMEREYESFKEQKHIEN